MEIVREGIIRQSKINETIVRNWNLKSIVNGARNILHIKKRNKGQWLNWLEHWTPNPAVGGSIPSCPARWSTRTRLSTMDNIKNLSSDTVQFAKDIENEAKRITWPSRNETLKSTLAVIVISAIFASFLGLVDYIFSIGIKFLLS